MKCNVGGAERAIRTVIGVALLVPMDVVWRVVLLVPAGVAFFTVVSRYCPLNDAIGLNTCRQPCSP